MPTTCETTDTATIVTVQIIGTDLYTLTAWEPYADHASMRSDDGDGWLGLITQRPIAEDVAAMVPGSPERMDAAVSMHAAWTMDALAAIAGAYPDLLDREDVTIDGGAVTCRFDPAWVPCHGGCGEIVKPSPEGIAWCGTVGQ